MNTSGEAADQVIRMSLNGVEVAARISGKAALEVATMLYAVMKDQKKTKGKTRLTNLLKSGKPLTVFTLPNKDLASFQKEAKKYGILYYAVRNQRSNSDGMVDIMVKSEDAPRINRIVERFKLADVSQTAQVKTDIEKKKAVKKPADQERPLKDHQTIKQEEEEKAPLQKEEVRSNPKVAKTTKSPRSEPFFDPAVGIPNKEQKPSVRAQLQLIQKEQIKAEQQEIPDKQVKPKTKQRKPKQTKKKER